MPFHSSYNDTADVLGAILRGNLAWDDHAQRDDTIGVLPRRTSNCVAILLCICCTSVAILPAATSAMRGPRAATRAEKVFQGL